MMNQKTSKIILVLSVLVFLFYLSSRILISNVYDYAFVGAVFELLFIPMLGLLVAIPILCIIQLIKFKGPVNIYAIASILLLATAIWILVK